MHRNAPRIRLLLLAACLLGGAALFGCAKKAPFQLAVARTASAGTAEEKRTGETLYDVKKDGEILFGGGEEALRLTVDVYAEDSVAVSAEEDMGLYVLGKRQKDPLRTFVVHSGEEVQIGPFDGDGKTCYTLSLRYPEEPGQTPVPGPEQVALEQTEIRAEVRRYLHSNRDLFDQAELDKITFLDLTGESVTDLSDLRHFPNLTELTLRKTALEDYGILTECPALQRLEIHDGGNEVLSALPELPGLKELSLTDGMTVSDLSGLANLPGLETLTVTVALSAVKTDPAPLKALGQLTELDLTVNGDGEKATAYLDAVAGLTKLTRLSLYLPEVASGRDYGCLSALETLKTLSVSMCAYGEMATLPKLENLMELTVRGVDTAPVSLAHMERFPALMHLTLSHTGVRTLDGLAPLTKLATLALVDNDELERMELNALTALPSLARVEYAGHRARQTVQELKELLPQAYVTIWEG